jgi:hypothetical protein
MLNTRNKSGISAHPCIILYICHSEKCVSILLENATETYKIKQIVVIDLYNTFVPGIECFGWFGGAP